MVTYILMTKLSTEVNHDMKAREAVGKKWKQQVKKACPKIKFIAHYALLGPYDFMDIYEVPCEEDAARVSMISLATGAVKAESWTAIPYNRFIEIAKEI